MPRRKRLSADLPADWLLDPQYMTLSDAAWRMHTNALMYAIGKTNGVIAKSIVAVLLPNGTDDQRQTAVAELVAANIWETTDAGWQVTDWETTQSTVEEIKEHRAQAAERQRRKRANDSVTRDIPRDTTRESRREYGTERSSSSSLKNVPYVRRDITRHVTRDNLDAIAEADRKRLAKQHVGRVAADG